MKKVLIATLVMLQLYQSKAQSVSVNYIKEFVTDSKSPFIGKKLSPYAVSGIGVYYSQHLTKLPVTINVSAIQRTRKPPMPRFIKYPDPPVYSIYSKENNIEADSACFTNKKSSSIDLLAGLGYILPHNENSKLVITLNADFGVAFNNNQSINFYFQRRLTKAIEVEKTQLIINPNFQAKYFISKNVGLNFTVGYNNQGGLNAGAGIVIGKKSNYVGHVTLLK